MVKGHEGNSWGSLDRDVCYIQDLLQNLQDPVQDENVEPLIKSKTHVPLKVLKYKAFFILLQSPLTCHSIFFLLLNVTLFWAWGFLLGEYRPLQGPRTPSCALCLGPLGVRLPLLPASDLHDESICLSQEISALTN